MGIRESLNKIIADAVKYHDDKISRMEKPVCLDTFDYESLKNLYEMGRQFIDELWIEKNTSNKLKETLKDEKLTY